MTLMRRELVASLAMAAAPAAATSSPASRRRELSSLLGNLAAALQRAGHVVSVAHEK